MTATAARTEQLERLRELYTWLRDEVTRVRDLAEPVPPEQLEAWRDKLTHVVREFDELVSLELFARAGMLARGRAG